MDDRKFFHITSVCRDDVEQEFREEMGAKKAKAFAKGLTDTEMRWIADKMADAYCDCCFWTALGIFAKEVKRGD